MKRVRIIISGDVQGVGFRSFIAHHAKERHIRGWVRNRPDKTVEAVFDGKREAVDELIELSESGPEIAWVDKVQVTEEEPLDDFADFEVLE